MSSFPADRAMAHTAFAQAPQLPAAHLPRPRLLAQLGAQAWRLVLLWGPPGYGKSALLAEHFGQSPSAEVVWLNLAGHGLTTEQFLARLAFAWGLAPRQLDNEQALLDRLGQRSAVLKLVLDDFPADAGQPLNALVERLLAQPLLQLYVTCRQRPDWNLPRLMLSDALLELDARSLAFTAQEQRCLQLRLLPHAAPAQLDALWQQTRGWCAGARLIMAAAGQDDDGTAEHWLGDYLQREWLARLDTQECAALLELAHLPRCSAAFCEQLWEGQQGARLFARLHGTHCFMVELEEHPGWFSLLPAVARAVSNRLGNSAQKLLRLRACRLYHALGQPNPAIDLALLAGRPDVAAGYLEYIGLEWLVSERNLAELMRWITQIPDELLYSTPRLLCLVARAFLLSWRLDEAGQCIEGLSRFMPLPDKARHRRLLANAQALRGALAALRGDGGAAQNHCLAALAGMSAKDWRSSVLCHATLARMAMARGDFDQALGHLSKAGELGRRNGSQTCELLMEVEAIRLLVQQGEPVQADALLQQCLVQAQSLPCHRLLMGRLLQLRAERHLAHGCLEACAADLQASENLAQEVGDPHILQVWLTQADLAQKRGDSEGAGLLLREAQRRMQRAQVPGHLFQPALDGRQWRLEPAQADDGALACELTSREMAVLRLLAEGLSNKEIGSQLFISLNTVKTHASSINEKLGVAGRTRAVMRAHALGLLL